jgi:hypothetical protein
MATHPPSTSPFAVRDGSYDDVFEAEPVNRWVK